MTSKLKLDTFISNIDKEALAEQGKTINDVSLWVSEKIYEDMKHLLKDGKYKGIKLIY